MPVLPEARLTKPGNGPFQKIDVLEASAGQDDPVDCGPAGNGDHFVFDESGTETCS